MAVDGPQMVLDENDEPVSGFNSAQCPVTSHIDMEQMQWICVDEWAANSEEDEAEGAQESSDTDISDNEMEAMLQDRLREENQEGNDQTAKKGNEQYTVHNYLTMEELDHNYFDVLPAGWIQIRHRSGVPLYLHSTTRVCTFARPYYLGQGSARKHQVPLSAIPCLQYKQALEKEKLENENLDATSNVQLPLGAAKIETAEEIRASQSLDAYRIHKYCRSLFRFKTTQMLRFESWSDRRRYDRSKKVGKQLQIPQLPGDTKVIKFHIRNPDDPDAESNGEWVMNPNGKSHICILHEYVQRALKKKPTYEIRTVDNPLFPFSATVIINGISYGCGAGASKKQAKLSAAEAALGILIPEMREKLPSVDEEEENSLCIFDDVKVDDPRVAELCAKTSEPFPFAVLLTCLKRNFDSKSMPIDYKVNPLHRSSNECIMTVGKHCARVICKNKRAGKQMASQAILQELHPYINSWGTLLRLYGKRSMRNFKKHKQEQKKVTMLQKNTSSASPNYALLEKLKREMMKLSEEKAGRPDGVFFPTTDMPLPSSSRG